VPDSKPPDAVESWVERVLSFRNAKRDPDRIVLWEAVSEGSDGNGFIAAGAVRLPQDDVMDLEEFAYALRGLLQRTTGDPTVTVQMIEPGEGDATGKTAAAEGAVAAFYDNDDAAEGAAEDARKSAGPSDAWDR
jgi:hypothetical protein